MSDRRGLVLLLTPVISLLDAVRQLNHMLKQHDVSLWPQDDRNRLVEYGRKLNKRKAGPLNLLRSERSGHQVADMFSDPQARARARTSSSEIIALLGECLMVLTLRMNHKHAFAWSRYPDPTRPNLVELQQEGCVGAARWITNDQNEVIGYDGYVLGYAGLLAAKKILVTTVEEYNAVAAMCSPPVLPIGLQERDIHGY